MHYFYVKAKMLADFQICISVRWTIFAKRSILDVLEGSQYAPEYSKLLKLIFTWFHTKQECKLECLVLNIPVTLTYGESSI